MTTRKLNLIAPSGAPVVGIRLIDDSTSEFVCRYDDDTRTFLYVLPSGSTEEILKRDGATFLVDSQGVEWSTSDVEYHSVLHG
jgi:hypothetical protein